MLITFEFLKTLQQNLILNYLDQTSKILLNLLKVNSQNSIFVRLNEVSIFVLSFSIFYGNRKFKNLCVKLIFTKRGLTIKEL